MNIFLIKVQLQVLLKKNTFFNYPLSLPFTEKSYQDDIDHSNILITLMVTSSRRGPNFRDYAIPRIGTSVNSRETRREARK